MNFKEFLSKTESSMQSFFGPETRVEIKEIIKNNGVLLNGLIINEAGDNIAPTIYMDGFYEEYRRGKSFGKVMEEIIALYKENKVKVPVNMDFFLNYDAVRGRIFQKVINYEKNKDMLVNVPHKRFLDLAVASQHPFSG